ncbi:MAG: metal ABC transporter permease [Phycisphaerales bacterium]
MLAVDAMMGGMAAAGVAGGGGALGGGRSLVEARGGWPGLGEVVEVLSFRGGYNTNVVIAGTALLGIAAGVVGVFALLRKRALVTDAVSHATLPGICGAFLLAGALGLDARSLPLLLLGAALAGVLGVVCIQLILRHSRVREDAAIGMVLGVFFGVGVVLLSLIQVHAAHGAAGLSALIYGQAATMRLGDVALMGGIALAGIGASALFLKEFALVCFDESFARVDGWAVGWIDVAMMGLVVLVTVAGLQCVGLILVVALLIVPPVCARFWTERLWVMVVISGAIGGASGYVGSVVSALSPGMPGGAVIVLAGGAAFVLSLLLAPSRGVLGAFVRRERLRVRIAGDHLLELAHESGSGVLGGDAVAGLGAERGWSRGLKWLVMWSLRRGGMIEAVGGGDGVRATASGLERGARVARNHALWEQYLVSYADIAPSHVDWSVDQVEHVLSEELVRELEAKLGSAEGAAVGAGGGGARGGAR